MATCSRTIEETRLSFHVMKKDCPAARWLFFLKKKKPFRVLLFLSVFAYSEHFLKLQSGTFSQPMAHVAEASTGKRKCLHLSEQYECAAKCKHVLQAGWLRKHDRKHHSARIRWSIIIYLMRD